MAEWTITADNLAFGGFSPGAFDDENCYFGNKNQANWLRDMDLTHPNYICPGPVWSALTNAPTTTIKGMLQTPQATGVAYGVGGAKLYKFTPTVNTADATWPHTIDKATVTGEDGEDVIVYKGNLYYSYNHSGSAGDIGKFDLSSTFDDDWGSTTPTGAAALSSAPHPFCVGGDDKLYFANGRYVGSFDGTTFDAQALDLPTGTVIQDLVWHADRLYISARKSSLSGSDRVHSSVYIWDGASESWETEIPISGLVGALHVLSGVVFVFYQDNSGFSDSKADVHIVYLSGATPTPVSDCDGSVPDFYHVSDFRGFLVWASSGRIHFWGSGLASVPARIFDYTRTTHSSTQGGITFALGSLIAASSTGGALFGLEKYANFSAGAYWQSLFFDITSDNRAPRLDVLRVNFLPLESGDNVTVEINDDNDVAIFTDVISYAKLGAATTAYFPVNKTVGSFSVEFNYTTSNGTNAVKIRNFKLYGSS